MEDYAGFFKWFVSAAIGVVGYFLRDLHVQFKEHVKDSEKSNARLIAIETMVPVLDKRLGDIDGKLDRLIERREGDRPGN